MNISAIAKQIGFLLIFLTLSWVLVHFLAVFGIFLGLALPLLHLVFYPHIICFWCRLRGGTHTLKHSLIDSGLIVLLTLISIPIVYLEYRLLISLKKPAEIAQVAQFMIPRKSQYLVGEVFPLKIELMNIPTSINVVQADLSFDPRHIEVVDITTDSTFASFFVQKEYDNTKGYLRISGGTPNPGYRQPTALLATAYFKGKAPGAIELKYLESSLVLANDGQGTNLLNDFPTIPLIITPANQSASPLPSDLTIRNQIQGDKDKTVLSFTEYGGELPPPYSDTLGISLTPTPTPIPHSSNTSKSSVISSLIYYDNIVLEYWKIVSDLLP
ncbi:MAG: hypothetical protein E6R05_04090 [Candidatus Moraniibacteriota bacterium]|nr:MAG: hypothetical protein E6R05_04090 [Candidatus Moranbacteria bacterium]